MTCGQEQRWWERSGESGKLVWLQEVGTRSHAGMKYFLEKRYGSSLMLFHRSAGCRIISGAGQLMAAKFLPWQGKAELLIKEGRV